MPQVNTQKRDSDVFGTYDIIVMTRALQPFLVDEIALTCERAFERYLSEQFEGIRVDSIKVKPDHVRILLTVKGDVRKPAKAFVHTAKQKVSADLREEYYEEFLSNKVYPTLGLFARNLIVRTVGEGITDEEAHSFLESYRESLTSK